MSPRPLQQLLVVEDNDDHAELLAQCLEGQEIADEVLRARDGEEALRILSDTTRRPDLILLDLNLPRISGLEVLRHVKRDPRIREVPVVVLTTSDSESDRTSAYRFQANSYLIKHIDFIQFQEQVHEIGLYWGTMNRPAPLPRQEPAES